MHHTYLKLFSISKDWWWRMRWSCTLTDPVFLTYSSTQLDTMSHLLFHAHQRNSFLVVNHSKAKLFEIESGCLMADIYITWNFLNVCTVIFGSPFMYAFSLAKVCALRWKSSLWIAISFTDEVPRSEDSSSTTNGHLCLQDESMHSLIWRMRKPIYVHSKQNAHTPLHSRFVTIYRVDT